MHNDTSLEGKKEEKVRPSVAAASPGLGGAEGGGDGRGWCRCAVETAARECLFVFKNVKEGKRGPVKRYPSTRFGGVIKYNRLAFCGLEEVNGPASAANQRLILPATLPLRQEIRIFFFYRK